MRLQDVMKYQPKRDRPASANRGSRDRNQYSNRDRKPNSSKKKKASLIRPGAAIETASRRREETIELGNSDEESSVEVVRYQHPKQHDDSSNESDEEDEIPYKMNFSQPAKSQNNSDSSDSDDISFDSLSEPKAPAEPLRPGDMIEYQNTAIFAAGSSMGYNTARVLGTTPGTNFPLKLSNGEYLDPSVRISRTHEYIKGKLYKHSGYWRPISMFRMRKRLLRNPDGTPVEPNGGVHERAKTFQKMRNEMHQKAVEYIRGDHDDPKDAASTSSSSSSEVCELRLEFERLSRERNRQLQKNKIKQLQSASSMRNSSSLLLHEDSDSDSDSGIDVSNYRTTLSSSNPSRPSLLLKNIARSYSSSAKKDAARAKDPTSSNPRIRTNTMHNKKPTHSAIDTSIDIDTRPKMQLSLKKYKRTDHLSTSSSSSSSIGNLAARKKPITKKRKSPPSTIFASNTVTTKSSSLLDDDSDSSDDDLLDVNPAFASTKKKKSQKSETRLPPHSNKKDPPRKSVPSPIMEQNPIDLFEDSSGDDDSSGGQICRRRNRRGERMLSSPSVDAHHRKQNRDDLLTQEDSASDKRTVSYKRTISSSSKTVKRSVVVGYRPLSLEIDGKQEELPSSPPSLAKAYRKRDAMLQQKREQQEGASSPLEESQRDQSKRTKNKKQKSIDTRECNRRKLQREKQKLKQQRPPPYPPKRSDPILADRSTQEKEWTDIEQEEESFQYQKQQKRRKRERAKKMAPLEEGSSFDSKPPPQKLSMASNQKQNSKRSCEFSISDSDDEAKNCGRKRLTPKSRLNKSKSKARDARNQTETKRYELSPSSSESSGVFREKTPKTPWSTDCEIESPLPSTIKILKKAPKRNTMEGASAKTLKKSKKRKRKEYRKASSSVFEFASQDENYDPSKMGGGFSKRRLSPKLANLSKHNCRKQKSSRKHRTK